VVNRVEEEDVRKNDKLMEEVGESRGGWLRERVILTRCETVRRLCPHSLLHYCQYVPLDCASGSVLDAKPLAAASGTVSWRSAVRRQRRRLQCGKRMASNFSILQRTL
jgi:hypothetical protein